MPSNSTQETKAPTFNSLGLLIKVLPYLNSFGVFIDKGLKLLINFLKSKPNTFRGKLIKINRQTRSKINLPA